MKKISLVFDFQKFQQNSKLAAVTRNTESHYSQTVLSDEDLGQVSAAGDFTVPTMKPGIVLGRHDIPEDAEKRRP